MPSVLVVTVAADVLIEVRSMAVMLFDPVLATIATPESGLIATPVGFVPVLGVRMTVSVSRFTMESVPSVLFATTAYPIRGMTSTPEGAVPTAIVFLSGAVEPGVRSTTETLPQPLLETTAMFRVVSIATALGAGAVEAPHDGWRSTDWTAEKSVGFDPTPPTTTSRAYRLGTARNEAGICASTSLLLTTFTVVNGVPSRRTAAGEPDVKPEPKICTVTAPPAVGVELVVSTACGRIAPGALEDATTELIWTRLIVPR